MGFLATVGWIVAFTLAGGIAGFIAGYVVKGKQDAKVSS